MAYSNPQRKRQWEQRHREDRNVRRRELRALEKEVLGAAHPSSNRNRRELLQQAQLEGRYDPRKRTLRIDAGKVSVVVPGDAVGRALSRAVRWLRKKK